jgi:hypothetical protein
MSLDGGDQARGYLASLDEADLPLNPRAFRHVQRRP